MGNYRPISVLKKRLLKFLEENSIIDGNQNGFLTKKSTQSAITTIMEYMYIERNKIILVIFLDLCKAFDVVNHGILLQKLELIGVRGNSIGLFENYLENRVQYTSICSYNSTTKKCAT